MLGLLQWCRDLRRSIEYIFRFRLGVLGVGDGFLIEFKVNLRALTYLTNGVTACIHHYNLWLWLLHHLSSCSLGCYQARLHHLYLGLLVGDDDLLLFCHNSKNITDIIICLMIKTVRSQNYCY